LLISTKHIIHPCCMMGVSRLNSRHNFMFCYLMLFLIVCHYKYQKQIFRSNIGVCKSVFIISNRFFTCQYQQLHSYVWNKPGMESEYLLRQWDRVVNRIKEQLILRAMSCMQLASKFVETSKVGFMYCHYILNLLFYMLILS
jgi:hypothetical protein